MPSASLAFAASGIVAGATYVAPSPALVRLTLGGRFPDASKNTPLTIAPPPPPVSVTCTVTCPRSVHTQYWPPLNPAAVRVSSKLPVVASRMSNRSTRAYGSQSTIYSATRWAAPSVRLISTEKLPPYHVAAIRSAPAAFCSARPSLVELAHVHVACPLGVTVA